MSTVRFVNLDDYLKQYQKNKNEIIMLQSYKKAALKNGEEQSYINKKSDTKFLFLPDDLQELQNRIGTQNNRYNSSDNVHVMTPEYVEKLAEKYMKETQGNHVKKSEVRIVNSQKYNDCEENCDVVMTDHTFYIKPEQKIDVPSCLSNIYIWKENQEIKFRRHDMKPLSKIEFNRVINYLKNTNEIDEVDFKNNVVIIKEGKH